MSASYLQYIESVYNTDSMLYHGVHFLISGMDLRVRKIVAKQIISKCRSCGKNLLIVDNTKNCGDIYSSLQEYHMVDVLSDQVCICNDIFDTSSIRNVSRLRSLLSDLGFDEVRSMKLITYISFVKETEKRIGNMMPLNIDMLEEYGSIKLVEWKLKGLLKAEKINKDSYEYLLVKYAEISSVAADMEHFLLLIKPFISGTYPTSDMAIHFPFGEFASDKLMQKLMRNMLVSYVNYNVGNSALLVLDNGKGERSFLVDIVNELDKSVEMHFISEDIFTLEDSEIGILVNTFPVKIYSRHENICSCSKIENQCGQIDVVKKSFAVTVDRRWKANSAWDMLFGNNRTDTETRNVPVKEYLFRKELINSFCEGTGIIDCGGYKVMFTF